MAVAATSSAFAAAGSIYLIDEETARQKAGPFFYELI
jgi:hypothetical protein